MKYGAPAVKDFATKHQIGEVEFQLNPAKNAWISPKRKDMRKDTRKDMKMDSKTIEFYGKLTQEEIDKIDQSKGEIFLDFPCPKCGGEVGHRINCPDGIASNEEGKMAFCQRMKFPNKGTELKEGTGFGDLPYAPWEKNKP